MPSSIARQTIGKVISDIKEYHFSKTTPFKIGRVEKRMKDFAMQNGIVLGSFDIYMDSSSISHALRHSKVEKGLAVSEEDLQNFPLSRFKMDLYYDNKSKNIQMEILSL